MTDTRTTRVIHQSSDTRLQGATADGDALWLDRDQLERATGWLWKPQGLCRADACMPVPRTAGRSLVDGDRIDAAGVWRYAGWPVAHDRSGMLWVLGEGAARRADTLSSLQAPDVELPDLDGRLHRLSDHRGRRVFLVTWASWCGCRADLPLWQALHDAARGHDFTVLAIALDQPDAARPWIEAAAPGFPCLIDRDHLTAELYNLVNVPQAVWIDEVGRLVRPPETAGMTDGFRAVDRATFTMPPATLEERQRVKTAYLDAVRDWAVRGAASRYALDADAVLARLHLPDPAIAEAHARFRLGQALLRDGQAAEAGDVLAEASRLHPASWAMWRQAADKDACGLAVGEAFWQRVDALGDRPYYAPVELEAQCSARCMAASSGSGSSSS
jgi:peroxiredoxin